MLASVDPMLPELLLLLLLELPLLPKPLLLLPEPPAPESALLLPEPPVPESLLLLPELLLHAPTHKPAAMLKEPTTIIRVPFIRVPFRD